MSMTPAIQLGLFYVTMAAVISPCLSQEYFSSFCAKDESGIIGLGDTTSMLQVKAEVKPSQKVGHEVCLSCKSHIEKRNLDIPPYGQYVTSIFDACWDACFDSFDRGLHKCEGSCQDKYGSEMTAVMTHEPNQGQDHAILNEFCFLGCGFGSSKKAHKEKLSPFMARVYSDESPITWTPITNAVAEAEADTEVVQDEQPVNPEETVEEIVEDERHDMAPAEKEVDVEVHAEPVVDPSGHEHFVNVDEGPDMPPLEDEGLPMDE